MDGVQPDALHDVGPEGLGVVDQLGGLRPGRFGASLPAFQRGEIGFQVVGPGEPPGKAPDHFGIGCPDDIRPPFAFHCYEMLL